MPFYVLCHFSNFQDSIRVFEDVKSAFDWALDFAESWDKVTDAWSPDEKLGTFETRWLTTPFEEINPKPIPKPIFCANDLQICLGSGNSPPNDFLEYLCPDGLRTE
jgi:hypothetical protein